jgi:hypothetical protein
VTNKLSFAVHLCTLRWRGHFLRDTREIPLQDTLSFARPTTFSIVLHGQEWKRGARYREEPAHCPSDTSARHHPSFCRS